MVFFLLALIFTYKVIQAGKAGAAILLGIFSGLAALTRAVFVGFFPVLLFLVWWMGRRNGTEKALPMVLAVLFFGLVLTPWTLRNYALHGTLVPVSSWGGQSLLIGNNPFATGTWSLKPGFDQWYKEQTVRFGVNGVSALKEVDVSKLDREIAVSYMITHLGNTVWLAVKKAFIFFVYPITSSDSYLPTQAAATAFDFLIYVGVAIGLVVTWSERQRLAPLYAAVVFFTLVQVVLHSEARYRLPLVPLFCLFLGWGVVIFTDRQRRTEFLANSAQKGAAVVLVGAVAIVYVFTGWLFLTGKV